MHIAAHDYVAAATARYGLRHKRMLEIGSRLINGTIRDLFTYSFGIDVLPGLYVDAVADGATYVPQVAPEVVVCCEVLEHTASAEAICRNAFRMLEYGGYFIVTAAGPGRTPHSAFNGQALREDEFYRNVSEADLITWMSDFFVLEVSVTAEDIYAIGRKA